MNYPHKIINYQENMVCKDGRKDDALWRRVKRRITRSACCGTKPNQWSARKAQKATKTYQKEYEQHHGNRSSPYCGSKTPAQQSMSSWTRARWRTKSGLPSTLTGERYLPEAAIRKLSASEYDRTSRQKRRDTARGRQFSRQPNDIARKVARIRRDELFS